MIDVVDVKKRFQRGTQVVEALRGVSFHVERGRFG